ncbi:MAG: hypothetical protein H0X55_08500 [Thermoleophilaceae bacterium]|nr:hypothetical protein [Thermoleophilaceae bacterium]
MIDVRTRVAVLASGAVVLVAVLTMLLGSALRWVPWPTAPLPTAVERLLTIDPLLDPGRFATTSAAEAPNPLGELRRALRTGGFDDGARGGIPRLFVATRSAGAVGSDRADRSRRRRGVRGRDRDGGASARPGTPISVEEAAEDDPDDSGNGRGDGGDDDDRDDDGGGSPSGGGGGSAVSNGGDADGNGDGEPNAGDGTGGNGRGDGNAGKGKGKDGNSGNGGNADDDDGGAARPSPARSRGGGQDDDD